MSPFFFLSGLCVCVCFLYLSIYLSIHPCQHIIISLSLTSPGRFECELDRYTWFDPTTSINFDIRTKRIESCDSAQKSRSCHPTSYGRKSNTPHPPTCTRRQLYKYVYVSRYASMTLFYFACPSVFPKNKKEVLKMNVLYSFFSSSSICSFK